MRKRFLVVCLLPLLLVTAAACTKSNDGKGVASVNGSATPSATPSLSLLGQGIRWARCMRQHGVPMPDPVVANGDGIRFEGADKDAFDRDVAEKADEACKPYRPVLPADGQRKKLEAARQESRCLREHGVASYPDPDPNDLGKDLPQAVRDDPQYEQAKEICTAQIRSSRPSPSS
ncbi:hypothetical protein [Actinomadura sp. HBU206391]|uniref:hypothetical protein n=1 Tax=Actinomadura sp. HBU206391 TaxID=2731692 RepID=UPI001650A1F5|nr:hypothetical protein [Actinomadura sp. HBU206391]MBC6461963.1 hypothetical protein [Actinomadura sp. HBU206391]